MSIAVSGIGWWRRVAVLAVGVGALVATGAGGATVTALPTIYINYVQASCQFTVSTDSNSSVTNGTAIAYGNYQIQVTTSGSYSGSPATCNGQSESEINFSLTGPGGTVLYTTTDDSGDGVTVDGTVTLNANTSYTASDSDPGGSTITFSTNDTAVSSASGSSGATSTTSTGGNSVLGGNSTTGSTSTVPNRGSLAASVSSTGKLALRFKGKAVSTLLAGDYKITVSDKSHKLGFILKGVGHSAKVLASGFGSKTSTVDLTAGQWAYYGKSGGAKISFYVES